MFILITELSPLLFRVEKMITLLHDVSIMQNWISINHGLIISSWNNITWLRHDMETLSTLLVLCEGNPPSTGGFSSQSASNADLFSLWCEPKQTVTAMVLSEIRSNVGHVTTLVFYLMLALKKTVTAVVLSEIRSIVGHVATLVFSLMLG